MVSIESSIDPPAMPPANQLGDAAGGRWPVWWRQRGTRELQGQLAAGGMTQSLFSKELSNKNYFCWHVMIQM